MRLRHLAERIDDQHRRAAQQDQVAVENDLALGGKLAEFVVAAAIERCAVLDRVAVVARDVLPAFDRDDSAVDCRAVVGGHDRLAVVVDLRCGVGIATEARGAHLGAGVEVDAFVARAHLHRVAGDRGAAMQLDRRRIVDDDVGLRVVVSAQCAGLADRDGAGEEARDACIDVDRVAFQRHVAAERGLRQRLAAADVHAMRAVVVGVGVGAQTGRIGVGVGRCVDIAERTGAEHVLGGDPGAAADDQLAAVINRRLGACLGEADQPAAVGVGQRTDLFGDVRFQRQVAACADLRRRADVDLALRVDGGGRAGVADRDQAPARIGGRGHCQADGVGAHIDVKARQHRAGADGRGDGRGRRGLGVGTSDADDAAAAAAGRRGGDAVARRRAGQAARAADAIELLRTAAGGSEVDAQLLFSDAGADEVDAFGAQAVSACQHCKGATGVGGGQGDG